mmetsp:Transcript_13350/g.15306  ORF Transcript_13350/g.15306 Transcript_13350/m.15306 type:complete len:261 (+) Transcript_13350:304-1086(+)
MPNKRKRKATTNNTSDSNNMLFSGRSSKKSSRHSSRYGSSTSHHSSSLPSLNDSQIESMFEEYAQASASEEFDYEPEVTRMEGFSVFCEQLDLDPCDDIRVLVLLWKLGANSKPQLITKKEWISGCQTLRSDSLAKFRDVVIPTLDPGFMDNDNFKSFYKFCFQFNREGTHKTLEKDMAIALWKMVFSQTGERVAKDRYESFCDFLEESSLHSRITLDQWTSFWDFCQECPDINDYDEDTSAWPVLFDEYVECIQQKQKK